MHGRARSIGSCEVGGVHRELWDGEDLVRSYFQVNREALDTHNWVDAKGLIYYGHTIVEP